MNKVHVFNDNIHPIEELFKGEKMRIEAKSYWMNKDGTKKVLDVFEANDYRGQYAPVPFDGSGKMVNDPRYFKMIKIEPVKDVSEGSGTPSATTYKCMAKECKHVSPSSEELEAHTKARHADLSTLSIPEVDEGMRSKKVR